MTQPFVHLHVHSEFSLVDGIVKFAPLVKKCTEFDQPAVALTDVSNVYGMVKFYRACLSNGIKPVLGCDVWIENPFDHEKSDRSILFCMNNSGFRFLSRILTHSYLKGDSSGKIVISWDELTAGNSDLICLMDDQQGPVANISGHASNPDAKGVVEAYQKSFGDRLYLSISRIGNPLEQGYINSALQLSREYDIGLVATNRVVFIEPEEFEAHEIRVCINDSRILDDSRRPRNFTDQQYLKSGNAMEALFSDIPASLANTVEIAKRCNMFLDFDQDYLPEYPDTGDSTVEELLREEAEKGLARRFGKEALFTPDNSPEVDQKYIDRLNMELDVIEQMGYPGYFLIVADFIKWSRNNGIPVGPGRGSGAGSLVAYATGITEIDPLPYGLIFERFLNPERISLPDFDIDFCVDGRDRVIEYVAQRYGHDQVAQIITFGTMAAKAVVRDVGRVMGFPYGFVDQIAKLIPFEVGMTLDKALNQEEQLKQRYDDEADVQELIDSALKLEGVARNVGKHAGGVVISPKPLTEYTPLYADSHLNQAITQLDKDDLESIGLVKFDFLGLRTLTIIDSAVKMINQQRAAAGESSLDITNLPLDDEATFEFVRSGRTTAIFQLESRGMKELIIRARPESFEDLIALIAMFRPGPLQSGMVEDFVNRKAGRETFEHMHPDIEPVLNTTYGVILYQEQVMKIAQILAGYTLGSADILRKAMGKKLPAEMEKQRKTFLDGAEERGVDKKIATTIFDLMDKFAGYGFNKSHSAAYALISYQTAWLKTHYPAAYMAATLSADLDNTDKVVTLLADCYALDLEILPPDINSSLYTFKPVNDHEISYGLGAVKGVGQAVIENIVDERNKNGPFSSLFDFCQRLDMRKVNKRVFDALIKSGAMDALGANRASLMSEISNATRAADQQQQNQQVGQFDMFGVGQVESDSAFQVDIPEWPEDERLKAEKDTLGLYLTGHPYLRYAKEFSRVSESDISGLDLSVPRNGIFAGIMVAKRVLNTRRGKMAFITLDNAVHRVEISLFSEKFNEYFSKLQSEGVLIALGELSTDEFTGGCQMRADLLFEVDEIRKIALQHIEIQLDEGNVNSETIPSIKEALAEHRGGKTRISIRYTRERGETGVLKPGDGWCVTPNQQLFDNLAGQLGDEKIIFHYDTSVLHQLIPQKPNYRQKIAVNH